MARLNINMRKCVVALKRAGYSLVVGADSRERSLQCLSFMEKVWWLSHNSCQTMLTFPVDSTSLLDKLIKSPPMQKHLHGEIHVTVHVIKLCEKMTCLSDT